MKNKFKRVIGFVLAIGIISAMFVGGAGIGYAASGDTMYYYDKYNVNPAGESQGSQKTRTIGSSGNSSSGSVALTTDKYILKRVEANGSDSSDNGYFNATVAGYSLSDSSASGSGSSYTYSDYETMNVTMSGPVNYSYSKWAVFTFSMKVTYIPITVTEESRGSLHTSNIIAKDGTYPTNGKHYDGYWYVRKTIYNITPSLTITTENNQQITNSITITGNSSDPNGDTVSVYYNIDGGGTHTIVGSGNPGPFSMNVSTSALSAGGHTLNVWAIDSKNGSSSVSTISFTKIVEYYWNKYNATEGVRISTIPLGSIVYEPNTKYNSNEIQWYTVSNNQYASNSVMLFSKTALFKKPFHDSSYPQANSLWDTSDLRSYLNTNFYNDNFSGLMKSITLTSKVPNKTSNKIEYNTNDKIFIPAQGEILGFYSRVNDVGTLFDVFPEGGEYTDEEWAIRVKGVSYWLRNTQDNNTGSLPLVVANGQVDNVASSYHTNAWVAPVMNIKNTTIVKNVYGNTYEIVGTEQKGALHTANLKAYDGTYPVDGLHTDGFWYVRGAEINDNPFITITTPVDNKVYSANQGHNQITLTGSVIDDNDGDTITTYYSVDGETEIPIDGSIITSGSFTPTIIDVSGLIHGDHTLSIWAKDQTDKISNTVVITFKVDKEAPIVTADNIDYSWKNQDINVNLLVTDTPAGVAGMEIKVTNSIDVPGSYDAYVGQITLVDEGTYYVHFTAVDAVGNVINNYFGPYRIDKTVPSSPLIMRDPDSDINNGDYVVTIIPGTDDLSGVAATKYRLTGAVSQDWTDYIDPFNITIDGLITIEAKTIDLANNESEVIVTTVFSYDGLYLDAEAAVLIAEASNLQADKDVAIAKIELMPLDAPERTVLTARLNLVQEIIDIRAGIQSATTMADIESLWVRIQAIPDEHPEKPILIAELIQKAIDLGIITTPDDVSLIQDMIDALEDGPIKDNLQDSFNAIKTPILLDAAMQSLIDSIAALTSQGTVYIDLPSLPIGQTSTFAIEENGELIYTTNGSGHVPLLEVIEGHAYTFKLVHSDLNDELGSRTLTETIPDLTNPVVIGAYVLNSKLHVIVGDNYMLQDDPVKFTRSEGGEIIESTVIDDNEFVFKEITDDGITVIIYSKKIGVAAVVIPSTVSVTVTDLAGLSVAQNFDVTKANEALFGDIPDEILNKIDQANNPSKTSSNTQKDNKGSIRVIAVDDLGDVLTTYLNEDLNLTLQVVTAPEIPGYNLTSTQSITVWLKTNDRVKDVTFYYIKNLEWEGWKEQVAIPIELHNEKEGDIPKSTEVNDDITNIVSGSKVSYPKGTSIEAHVYYGKGKDYNESIEYDENVLNNQADIDSLGGVGAVWGIVTDSLGNPLEGILVELHSNPRTTYTNSNGEYRFDNVEVGKHNIIIKDIKQPLFISNANDKRIDFKIVRNSNSNQFIKPSEQSVMPLKVLHLTDNIILKIVLIMIFLLTTTVGIFGRKNIFIYTEKGEKVFALRHKNKKPLELDFSALSKGVYNIKTKGKLKNQITIINGKKKEKSSIQNGHLVYELK